MKKIKSEQVRGEIGWLQSRQVTRSRRLVHLRQRVETNMHELLHKSADPVAGAGPYIVFAVQIPEEFARHAKDTALNHAYRQQRRQPGANRGCQTIDLDAPSVAGDAPRCEMFAVVCGHSIPAEELVATPNHRPGPGNRQCSSLVRSGFVESVPRGCERNRRI
jgi:hypothetical protein